MKKVISLVLIALLMMSGVALAQPAFRQSPGEGAIMNNLQGGTWASPTKTFRMVRWAPAQQGPNVPSLTADSIVIWDANSDDGVTVTTTTTSNDSAVAGLIPVRILTPDASRSLSSDVGQRNWGYLQTYGYALADCADDTVIAAKGKFGTSDQAGLIGGPGALGGGGETAAATNLGLAGFVFDAVTASKTEQEVFIQCE